MHVAGIRIYPVKSARGITIAEAEIEARGFAGDRRWMVVDETDRFVSQRELPALARLVAAPSAAGLTLRLDGAAMNVAVPAADAPRTAVSVWRDTLMLPEAPAAAAWLSRCFGRSLRLFYQTGDAPRPIGEWGEPGDNVSLADAFPLLLASTSSLAALESEIGAPLGMERFRPNLIIEGAPAWAEDSWARIRIAGIDIELVKPCTRCATTTVDQERGEVAGDEPLATLRRIRMSDDRRVPGVLFAWNAIPRQLGTVRVGDEVTVIEHRAPWPLRDPARLRADRTPAVSLQS
jgi:uncharacterized protein YcbX